MLSALLERRRAAMEAHFRAKGFPVDVPTASGVEFDDLVARLGVGIGLFYRPPSALVPIRDYIRACGAESSWLLSEHTDATYTEDWSETGYWFWCDVRPVSGYKNATVSRLDAINPPSLEEYHLVARFVEEDLGLWLDEETSCVLRTESPYGSLFIASRGSAGVSLSGGPVRSSPRSTITGTRSTRRIIEPAATV